MVFGAVLAGGIGSRMGNEKPKQYLNIGGKPIIVHTLEKFYVNNKFEKIIVLCPQQWINHTQNLINSLPLWQDCNGQIILLLPDLLLHHLIQHFVKDVLLPVLQSCWFSFFVWKISDK